VRTVLVSGGAGLLGAAASEELLRRGNRVIVADACEVWGDGRAVREDRIERLRAFEEAVAVRTDLTDPVAVAALLRDHRPDAILNAALFPPGGAGIGPLIGAARAAGTGFFLHLSDGALYGNPQEPGTPAREDEPLEPGPDPALQRRAAEEELVRSGGVPFAILRIFEVIGPSQPPGRFPAGALESLLAGDRVDLPDDEPRDLIDIWDAVRGILLALDRRPAGQTVNVGTGRAARPSELVSLLAARAFRPMRHSAGAPPSRRPRVADTDRARDLLGFVAERFLDASAASIVAARLLGPPEEVVSSPRPRISTGTAVAPEPRSVSRRELFGFLRRPFRGG
jgi:nucleoside-diphosphate-sugar epimerase